MTHVETADGETLPHGAPELREVTVPVIKQSLEKGWEDFKKAPAYGLFFGGFYAIGGLIMYIITQASGQSYWMVLAVLGVPPHRSVRRCWAV